MASLTRLKKDSAYVAKELWGSLFSLFKQETTSLKLMSLVVGRINPLEATLEDLKSIKIPLREIYEAFDLYGANKLSVIKRATKKIVDNSIEIETSNGWYPMPLFDFNETFIDYRNGFLHVSIPDGFFPFFTNLSKFLQIRVATTHLTNRCFTFYCVLMQTHKEKIFNFPITSLQGYCNVNYPTYSTFKQQFLTPVIQELGEIGINIRFNENKIGTRVESLHFTIDESILLETIESQIPEAALLAEDKIETKPDKLTMDTQNIYNCYLHYMKKTEKDYRLTPKRKAAIKARLKTFTFDDIHLAIQAFSKDDWQDRAIYTDLTEYVLRNDEQLEKWINTAKAKGVKND